MINRVGLIGVFFFFSLVVREIRAPALLCFFLRRIELTHMHIEDNPVFYCTRQGDWYIVYRISYIVYCISYIYSRKKSYSTSPKLNYMYGQGIGGKVLKPLPSPPGPFQNKIKMGICFTPSTPLPQLQEHPHSGNLACSY